MRSVQRDNRRPCRPLLSTSQSTQGSHLVNMSALPASLLSLLVCCLSLSGAIPSPQTSTSTTQSATTASGAQNQHEVVSHSQVVSAANGYLVKVEESQVNNQCVAKLSISGNGINKTVDYSCGKAPVDIISLNQSLLVGEEWYSGEPKTLVHLSGKQCQKEVFTEQNGKISSTSETLSDEECDKVRTKISQLKKENQKWNEWLLQQQLAAQEQFQQLQQNLQWFQHQLFGSIFGGK